MEEELNLDVLDFPSVTDVLDLPEGVNISTFLYYLFSNNRFTDVQFSIKEHKNASTAKTFSAHKLVLALWSPYFADLLYSSDKELPNVIRFNDVDADAFQEMLRFTYGHPPSLELPSLTCKLHKVAVKFQIARLVDICHYRLTRFVPNVSNVFDTFEVANYLESADLKNRCMALIKEETKQILQLNADYNVSPDVINTILDVNEMSLASEYELLIWLFTWAKNEYARESMYSSPREVLIDYFPKLDFIALTSQEFVELFKSHQGIIEEKEAFSILMNIAKFESWPMPDWFCGRSNLRNYTGNAVSEVSSA